MPRTALQKKVAEESALVDYLAELVNNRERVVPIEDGGPRGKDVMHDHYDVWFYR